MTMTFDHHYHLHPDQHRIDHGMILFVDRPGGAVIELPAVEEHHFDVTTTVIVIIVIVTTIATRIVHRVEIMIHATDRVVRIAIRDPTTIIILPMTIRAKFE